MSEWREEIYNALGGRPAEVAYKEASNMARRPSVHYQPDLYKDGNKWCALYGKNLQEGCAGFGDSPEEAMKSFDKNWKREI